MEVANAEKSSSKVRTTHPPSWLATVTAKLWPYSSCSIRVRLVCLCHTCQVTSTNLSRPICILGLGLIGGSLLRDLAAQGVHVYGYNRSGSGARAASAAGFDASDDLALTLQRAEQDRAIIVVATPMPAIPGLLDAIMEHAPSCGITDVVSVKAAVYDLVKERGLEDRYVGGHPMAGTADSGWDASREGLFTRAAWVITYDHAPDASPITKSITSSPSAPVWWAPRSPA